MSGLSPQRQFSQGIQAALHCSPIRHVHVEQAVEGLRFLARLAAPRTRAEEQAPQPAIRMDELAFCLELLADQVRLVLDEIG